ncbi:BREX-1 system adenine-specific DNA-methyltransferase PglX [Crenothrix sp.]|uniref:BREX-1 system adenine-specific DNA-methyltransferase PglX n=1 Tax=Crenothrix sp. TaxID=3100433 RepID=UPI00374D240E
MLNPETITVLDPACGSGHILVEAYDVLKAIYLERGYRMRDIPRLILEKNLFGLDIDDRAAQLAGFALLMKARADDRRILDNPPKLNILSLQSSQNLNLPLLWHKLDLYNKSKIGTTSSLFEEPQLDLTNAIEANQYNMVQAIVTLFEPAKTFGALIQIPHEYAQPLAELLEHCQQLAESGDSFQKNAAKTLMPFLAQANILAMKFDAVVANPPYMGGKGMNPALKEFAKKHFPDSKSDMFAMFIERGFGWCKASGFNAQVTMQSWMFLSSYEAMREKLLHDKTISSLVQIGYNSFPEINSKIAQACAFSYINKYIPTFSGSYINLNSAPQSADKNQIFLNRTQDLIHDVCQDDFKKISGSPVAYWVKPKFKNLFEKSVILSKLAPTKIGMRTGDNKRFLRKWYEVSLSSTGLGFSNAIDASISDKKWFPYNKGGEFRRWYGNNEYLVNWKNNGEEIKTETLANYPQLTAENLGWKISNESYYFKPCVTWSFVSSSYFGARQSEQGFLFDVGGSCAFPKSENLDFITGYLCSCVAFEALKFMNPTLNFQIVNVASLPLLESATDFLVPKVSNLVCDLVKISKTDWNTYETSWDFTENPLIRQLSGELLVASGEKKTNHLTLATCYSLWQTQNRAAITEMKRLEEENNRLFIEAYGLQDELSPDVPEAQITLGRADREKDSQRLVSYAIGCMMGRYSLDELGLIYAHAGNIDFDPNRYNTFPADADGIVSITDELWFEDDAANRIREFLQTVWDNPSPQGEGVDANMAWLAQSLGQRNDETPEATIRRYIASNFFKDHLQTYKKRPIYWLFSSGKQGAFQALVYLHRYNESTLARLRNNYVVPLMGKLQNRIELLEQDAVAADSNASRNKLNKDIEKLKKKHIELLTYEEKLRHYADLRIQLDLDDGVKINYGKFGDLLAEVKAVTGGKDE